MARVEESVFELKQRLPDDASWLRLVFDRAIGPQKLCPRCMRPTTWVASKARRDIVSRCCGWRLSPCGSTFLRNGLLPLSTYFHALKLVCDFNGRLGDNLLARHFGIGLSAGQLLGNRIRLHMTALALNQVDRLAGPVCVDEMLICCAKATGGADERPVIVFGIANKTQCRLFCVPNRKRLTLLPMIARHVEPGAKVIADGWLGYNRLEEFGFVPSRVIHKTKEWRNEQGDATARIEQVWSEIRRILSAHNHVQGQNLWKVLGQFMFLRGCRSRGLSPFVESIANFPSVHGKYEERLREQVDLR